MISFGDDWLDQFLSTKDMIEVEMRERRLAAKRKYAAKTYDPKETIKSVWDKNHSLRHTKQEVTYVFKYRDIPNSPIKIGRTADVTRRLEQSKIWNPIFELVVNSTYPTGCFEKWCHFKLYDQRYGEQQEWFYPGTDIDKLWNEFTTGDGGGCINTVLL